MAKTAATASKKKPNPKKASVKTTGEDVIDINSPPNKRKKQCVANQAAIYFSTTTHKGYTVNRKPLLQ